MFHTNSTPKQSYKQQPQKYLQQIHQKTLPCHSLSPQQVTVSQHSKQIKFIDDQNPQTPQKFSITKNLKVINVPSQATENSFRSSTQVGTDSPLIVHNKENGQLSKRMATDLDNQAQAAIQENKKLNEMIQRLFKEKQELVSLIDKQKSCQQSFSSQQSDQINLQSLKERIERLEAVIDLQSEEILEWKQKYKQACEQDERVLAIDQMESQIMKVVEENERLNNLGSEKDKQIIDLTNNLLQLQKRVHEQDQKIKDQSNIIVAYEEDTKELKKQYNRKLSLIEKLEQQQKQSQNQDQNEFTQQTSFHESLSVYGTSQNSARDRDHQGLLDQLQVLEQQLSDLSTQYTSQVLENQRLLRQNNNLKEELLIQQKSLDDIRNTQRGAVNPKFQEANKSIKLIREKIVKSMMK